MAPVRISDEMAFALALASGGEHRPADVASAALERYGADATGSVPDHVLVELVVLVDAGGCEDLDGAVATACAVGEGGDDVRGAVRSIAEHMCGEIAQRRHAP
jgi:hypothetical protein